MSSATQSFAIHFPHSWPCGASHWAPNQPTLVYVGYRRKYTVSPHAALGLTRHEASEESAQLAPLAISQESGMLLCSFQCYYGPEAHQDFSPFSFSCVTATLALNQTPPHPAITSSQLQTLSVAHSQKITHRGRQRLNLFDSHFDRLDPLKALSSLQYFC